MAGLQSQGIGSGLDIGGLITKLMEVEKAPLTALTKKEADYQAKLSAYGSLKGAVATLQTSVKTLANPLKMNTLSAEAGDASVLSATTSSIAKSGSYNIEVSSLARAQKLYSKAFDAATETVGTGTITLTFGTYAGDPPTSLSANPDKTAKTIAIGSENATLTGVRDAINAADAGVTASIINDGEGYRLVIASNDPGAANAMQISVDDADGDDGDAGGLSSLAYVPGGALNMNQDADNTAQDAVIKIDGITVTKSSNTITDAIQGVTLNLLKTNVGAATTLTVKNDSTALKSAIQGFVKAFNELDATMDELGGYDTKTQKGGLLQGDSALRAIQTQVRNLLTSPVSGASGLRTLSDVGLSLQRDGTLSLDSAKLDKALADPTKSVASLFAPTGVASDGLIDFVGYSAQTAGGQYGVSITQMPARGSATGSIAAATEITTLNNALNLTVDGQAIGISLTPGSYTAATLATELQLRINTALSSSGKTVSVTQDAGALSVTSSRWGAASNVSLTGGSGLSALFGTPVETAGRDVAGMIGNTAAIGSGQSLLGTGAASGLELLVNGGGTGMRGSVGFSKGIATALDSLLGGFLDEDTGTIASKTSGIDNSIEQLNSQREVINRRLEQVQKRYQAQFTALDTMIASMQQTSAYLTQQLANLPSTQNS
jgi:flagellar hook-associated protein 2